MVLTNSQYEQLMSVYYERQLVTEQISRERQEEVRRAIPEWSGLDADVRAISLEHARARLSRGSHERDLERQIERIKRQKKQLLTAHGFPADYLKPVYHCPDCHDTGYVGSRKCHCFEREIVNFLYAQSNLKEVLDQENFSRFDFSLYPDDYVEEATGQTPRDNMRHIYNITMDFVEHFHDTPGNFLLYGNTGVGKTFLSHCIAKELLDRSHTVVYLTSVKLFDILETYKFDREFSHTERSAAVSYILDSDLLILDDLGTELNNSFTSSQLYHCIDTRLNSRCSTIISTNLSFDDLRNQYSERIFSRITSYYTLLKLTGDDIRLKKACL